MRRDRSVREHRNKLLRSRAINISERRKKVQAKLLKEKNRNKDETRISRDRLARMRSTNRRLKADPKANSRIDFARLPAYSPATIDSFVPYDEYEYKSRPAVVCHVIESIGLGGAQTMMMEMINGLNSYYGEHINNKVVCVHRKKQKPNKKLYGSYGVMPESLNYTDLSVYCKNHEVDMILHHRTANSQCLKKYIPKDAKYVLVNHTWNAMYRIKNFHHCDYYISVCDFLKGKMQWPKFIHESRKLVILNGIENDYIKNIEPKPLDGAFKTGRCHRLVASKFMLDSIHWMNTKVSKVVSGFKHYLIGTHPGAKAMARRGGSVKYVGQVLDRNEKMGMIKQFDIYFYETTQHEGASVAILESLACGVPVLCKPFGGNNELVRAGVNGSIVIDRSGYLTLLKHFSTNTAALRKLRKSTAEDFEQRLHVRHTACKYMQVIESLINEDI